MVYTEIKEKNGNKYYYRVRSVRKGKKVNKVRKYLGKNLTKKELESKEEEADKNILLLNNLLSKEEIKILENIKKQFKKEPIENKNSRYESFVSMFTYDSTNIEGNTLTLQETAQLLFENTTPRKSLREINEVLNHKIAFDLMIQNKEKITKKFICKLHEKVVKNTLKQELKSQIGKYRNVQVYIRGVEWVPPKPNVVPKEMKSLLFWYSTNKNKLHPLIVAAYFHSGFELIHPFVDGNGRVGRLLMNYILHRNNYPMINIPNKDKYKYYNCLEKAQVEGDLRPLVKFLFDILKNSKILF